MQPPRTQRTVARTHTLALEELAPAVASGGGGCAWRLPKRNPARIYYGAMTQVDDSFGVMLLDLERLGVRDSTIVILTSDNGPEHREVNSWGSSGGLRGAKGYVYEGGIRIPLLLQWPSALHTSHIVHEPVHQWDLMPTICAIVGVALPTDRVIDGVSIRGLLEKPGVLRARRDEVEDPVSDAAADAAAAEQRGEYIRLHPFSEGVVDSPRLVSVPSQAIPLPRPTAAGAPASYGVLKRGTPLFWAMHRGRGGMQYALRIGPWKLLGGYGESAARGDGPAAGADVVPWLRTAASIGRVELYLLSHDPAERVDLSSSRPEVVAHMLGELSRLMRETARDGPDVVGWRQRSPPCPRYVASLNVTELCCGSALVIGEAADEEVLLLPHARASANAHASAPMRRVV